MKSLFEHIEITTNLNSQKKETLKYSHVDTDEKLEKHHFTNEDQSILVTLQLQFEEGRVMGHVHARIANERPFARHLYFAEQKSITIYLRNVGDINGVMGNYQHKDWWTRPTFTTSMEELPSRVESLLWKDNSNQFNYMIPVVDEFTRTEMEGIEDTLAIHIAPYTGGFDKIDAFSFVITTGENPFELPEKAVKSAIDELGYPTLHRKQKKYPEFLDYLGWCTWDAFYTDVNEEGILQKLNELEQLGVPLKWLIIDDGWSEVKDQKLVSFDADEAKFPKGLKPTIDRLKQEHGINWVGVWHAFFGYWGGVHPESKLASEMKDSLYRTNNGKLIPYPDASKGFAFWNQWHHLLKKQGVDFVKVDGQSGITNYMMHQKSIGEAARQAHQALEASTGINFDNKLINCMGMASENIWNRPNSSVSRNSDDFVPGDEISFKEHALQNAYNSFYHSQFYWGDWDMFWTNHEEGLQNSVLRAVSGGPVYFSDQIGETKVELIWPLIYQDGKIIRADQPGLPTKDCLLMNPNNEKLPLKVWNTVNKTGVLALFNVNVHNEEVVGTISPKDIESIEGTQFFVYDYFKQEGFYLERDEEKEITLAPNQVALYTIIPCNDNIVPIGLVNKYLSYAGISSVIHEENKLILLMKEGGTLAFTSKTPVKSVKINGKETETTQHGTHYTIDTTGYIEAHVVEIG